MTSYIVFIRTARWQDKFGELVKEMVSYNFPRFYKVEVENLVFDMILISDTTEAVFALYGI